MDEKPGQLVRIARASSLGLTLALSVGLCTWLGYLGDQRWGTDPWLTVAGALLGTGGGFWSLYRELTRLTSKDD